MKLNLLAYILILLTQPAWSTSQVVVQKSIVVPSEAKAIYLNDLFVEKELSKFDKKTVKNLSKILLVSKIKQGESLEFSSDMISKIFRKVNPQKNIKIVIPQKLTLIHEKDVFNEGNVKKRLKAIWKQDCNDCVFKFLRLDLPKAEVKKWSVDSYKKLPRGYFTQALKLTLEDGSEKIRWAKGKIEIYKKTPVLTRSLSIGQRLKESDLSLELKNITYNYNPIADIRSLVGSKTRRYLSENQIVWLTDVDIVKSVKRGDVITIRKQGVAWELTTSGVAEQDGVIGDIIKVRGQTNRKLFSAKVTGDREVKLQ